MLSLAADPHPVQGITVRGTIRLRKDGQLLFMPITEAYRCPVFQAENECIHGMVHAEGQPGHSPQRQPADGDLRIVVSPAGPACLQGRKHPVRVILLHPHALHRMPSVLLGNQPGGAGAVPGVVGDLIHPDPAVALFYDILILSHGGMITIVGKLTDGKAPEIILRQNMFPVHVDDPLPFSSVPCR